MPARSRCFGPLALGAVALLAVAVSSAVPNATTAPAIATADTDTKFDIIFSTFLEETEERNNILKVLQNALNVPDGRIDYDEASPDKKGFLFGYNVIVRFVIAASSPASPNASITVRDSLNKLWKTTGGVADDARLASIGVVDIYNVPKDSSVPRFQVRTSFDLLWTLVIIAAGTLFMGFLGFVVFRTVMKVRQGAQDARVEAKVRSDAKEGQPAQTDRGVGAADGGTSVLAKGSSGSVRPWEAPDEEELTLVTQLASATSAANANPMLHVPQVSEELIRQRVTREQERLLAEFELPPESAPRPELEMILRPTRSSAAAAAVAHPSPSLSRYGPAIDDLL